MDIETETRAGETETRASAAPPAASGGWPRWQRVAFRFALVYYLLCAFPAPLSALVGTIADVSEVLGADVKGAPWSWLQTALGLPEEGWKLVTSWMDRHGLAPYDVIHQPTGSSDTGHDFARMLAILALSCAATAVWSLWPRAGRSYPRLGRCLHLVVRFDLAFTLFGYGFEKFYGGQFGELTLTRLTQEIGDTWPMTMVGTFLQASKPYELFGGTGEVLSGLLLFHPRTALLGAGLATAVMTQVCALNWLCGVPVKVFSAHLLLYAVLLLLPFRHRLWALLANTNAPPVDLRVTTTPRARRVLTALGFAWVLAALVTTHVQGMTPSPWVKMTEKSPLYGLWVVESMQLDGVDVPVGDATRWRDFAVDAGNMAWAREATGTRYWFEFRWDEAAGTAQVKQRGDSAEAVTWTSECGSTTTKVDPPLLLRNEERGKKVDGQRRTLVLKGEWRGRQLELRTVEKIFRLKTGFRLRQELPDFW